MKYVISISQDEGLERGAVLGTEWEVDTSDPEWRESLPTPAHIEAVVAGQQDDKPTVAGAVMVLRRLGYEDLADHVEGLAEPESVGAELAAAIRAITVDLPDDQPNGPAENAMARVELLVAAMPVRPPALLSALADFCNAWSDQTKRLRVAAEAFFGGDFRAPGGGS